MLQPLKRLKHIIANPYTHRDHTPATPALTPTPNLPAGPFHGRIDKGTQILLSLRYQELVRQGVPLTSLIDTEFSSFSQNGEDGVLLYLFSVLGMTNRKSVEICAGDCIECNSTNLVVNHGWKSLQFDGSEQNIAKGKAFYQNLSGGFLFFPPRMVRTWIEAETIDSVIRSNGFEGEIDLLSIDIDGMDYWVWKAIECVRPRVVIAEYNQVLGPDRSATLAYQPDFVDRWQEPCGASLAALVKLGREKGYRLVGSEHFGINAFFVRNDLGEAFLPEVRPQDCVFHYSDPFAESLRRWVEV